VLLVGGAAVVTADDRLRDVAGLVVPLTVVGGLWWRFERGVERAPGRARDRLRWVALGCVVMVLLAIPVAFAAGDGLLPVLATCLVVLVVPLAVVLAYTAPEGLEVRLVAARTVGLVITVVVAVAAWSGTLAGLTLVGVDTARPGVAALAAAGVAVGFAPVRRLVDRTVDLLLFGDRLDPVQAASRFAAELAAADDPVAVLRALRSVLGVPSAAVRDDAGTVLISSGPSPQPGLTYALPLNAAGGSVGDLVLGLRPGDTGPSSRDRPVLRIVVPALAQLVRARGLAEALERSRARVIEAVEDDRNRLRRDLHDGLGPALTGLAYAADAALNLLPEQPDRAAGVLTDLRADTTEAIGEVRRLVDGLRPAVLDDLGLAAALRHHAQQLRSRGGGLVTVRLDVAEPLTGLGAATELAVFRIVTEALTNVARHSGADRASVSVRLGPDGLDVAVEDPGGRAGADWTPGGGLRSMRDRVDQLGGRLEAGGRPEGGSVRVWLPLPSA
jgi:two-component system NarL family sensor kinase